MNSNFIKYLILLVSITLFFNNCAKIGSPQGGPKDIEPPKVVESSPAPYSTKFDGKKITITFDEFVQVKDLSKTFVISPPMQKKPEVTTRGKSVVITLREDLKPNSTYRFYFGDAIVDLHENNPISNYDFVFSTGDYVDSLALRGRVVSAFDEKPDKDGLYVLLYSQFNDTMPRKQLPDYISKCNEGGWFTLSHIRADTFMIFALKDLNQNFRFDQPNEPIAFADSLIYLTDKYFIPNDSLIKTDTTMSDSLKKVTPPFKPQIILYSFTQDYEKQFIKKYNRPVPEKIELTFNREPFDYVKISPINFQGSNWLIADQTSKNDSMFYWITDTSLLLKDTLKMSITYKVRDSIEQLVPKSDTLTLIYKRPIQGRGKRDAAKASDNIFKISSNTETKSTVDLNGKVLLTASHPVGSIDKSKISLVKLDGEKQISLAYTLARDSVFLRRYVVNFRLEPNYDYILTLDSASFTSFYQKTSDSTSFKFKTQKDDYYGNIKLTLSNVKEPMIIQLLNEKENIVTAKYIDKDGVVIFDFLAPEKYIIKAIYDSNRNGFWDTGNFGKKLQPEKVLYFNKEIPVRSNWDNEETWQLE